MKPIGKKITLTNEEKEQVSLGHLHIKKTDSYQKALAYFEEQKKVVLEGNCDAKRSRLWIDEGNMCIKMLFYPPKEEEELCDEKGIWYLKRKFPLNNEEKQQVFWGNFNLKKSKSYKEAFSYFEKQKKEVWNGKYDEKKSRLRLNTQELCIEVYFYPLPTKKEEQGQKKIADFSLDLDEETKKILRDFLGL